jgi:hypothetical protein
LQVGVCEDVTVDVSKDGVLLDDAGAVQVSAFQDDQTLVRCHARFGVALGRTNREVARPSALTNPSLAPPVVRRTARGDVIEWP